MTVTDPHDTTTCTPHQAARHYAAHGWRVLPITPGRKHPPIQGWQDAATTDPDTIDNWWTGLYRDHGVGIATGPGSGLWVLDIDVSDGKPGRANLEALEAEHGPLPRTVAAATGSGGRHLLFTWDPDRPVTNGDATHLPAGLDIRGAGGQIVVAPTVHPSGTPYTWITGREPGRCPVAEAPDWLYRIIHPPTPVLENRAPTPAPTGDPTDSAAEWLRQQHTWAEVLERDGWTVHSQRGTDTYWTRPGKHPRDGHSAVQHGDGALVIWTTEIPPGLTTAGRPTTDGSGLAVSLFGYLAGTRYGGDRSACARDARLAINALQRPATGLHVAGPAVTPGPADDGHQGDEGGEVDGNRHRRRLLTEAALAEIPPPVPLADGWFYRRSLAVLYGPAKKGKTFVAVDLAMSVATGRPWLCGPTQPGRVLYCLGEGVAGLHKRLQAWRIHHQVDTPAKLAILPHVPQLHNGVDVADFLEAIEGGAPDLIIIDTLARATVGVEENSSKDMGEVIAQLDRIKEHTGACVLVLHHTGKDAARGTRGSSALTGAIDTGVEVRGDTRAMTLAVTEQKDAEPADPRQFRAEAAGASIVMVPTADLSTASSSTLAVMDALIEVDTGGVPATVWRDMAAERGIPERTFHRAVKWLVDNREVVNVGTAGRKLYTANTTPPVDKS